MKKVILAFVFLILVCINGQGADALSKPAIDFIITEEINMSASLGSTDLSVDPLIIENCSSQYDICADHLYLMVLDGWELVEMNTDFNSGDKSIKRIALATKDGQDLANMDVSVGKIESKEEIKVEFAGKISTSILEEKTKIASLVVEIVPLLDSRTVLYEDGTFIINELLTDSSANEAVHGQVVEIYAPLGVDNSYDFKSYNDVIWKNNRALIKKAYIGSYIKPRSTANWFFNCSNMSFLDSNNLDMSRCTDASNMFNKAGSNTREGFKLIGLEDWDMSKVKSFSAMFMYAGFYCTDWNIGDLSSWNTSSVETLDSMFYLCGYKADNWNIGDIGNWDVSNVTDFYGTFRQAGESAGSFYVGNLGKWNVSKAQDMGYMFYGTAYEVRDVDIGELNWDISSVKTANQMFYEFGCSDTLIKLGTLTIGNDANYNGLMRLCANINISINVKNYINQCTDIFFYAAMKEGTMIKLIPLNEDAMIWCNEMISKYGANGTSGNGNITI